MRSLEELEAALRKAHGAQMLYNSSVEATSSIERCQLENLVFMHELALHLKELKERFDKFESDFHTLGTQA